MSVVMEMVGVPNQGHVTGRFLLGICHMVKGIHTLWDHRWEYLYSDEEKPLSEVGHVSYLTYNKEKAVYISGSGLFIYDLTKLPAMVLCLVEPPVRFLWCWLLFFYSFLFFILLLFFIHFQATLPCHRHSTLASQTREDLHQLWALPWPLLVAFASSSTTSATVLSGHFLPTGVYQGLLWTRQFFLEVCRTSCWSSKHRPSPFVCLIHCNLQSSYSEEFIFKLYQILSWVTCGKSLVYLLLTRFDNIASTISKLFLKMQSGS